MVFQFKTRFWPGRIVSEWNLIEVRQTVDLYEKNLQNPRFTVRIRVFYCQPNLDISALFTGIYQ